MLVEVISSGVETNTILNAGSKPSIGKSRMITDIRIVGTTTVGRSGNMTTFPLYESPNLNNNTNLGIVCNRIVNNRTFFIWIDINRQIVNNKTSTRGLIMLLQWKGCHVHSNIFIRLVSCYLCVSYLVASVIIINLLCYSDLNLDISICLGPHVSSSSMINTTYYDLTSTVIRITSTSTLVKKD